MIVQATPEMVFWVVRRMRECDKASIAADISRDVGAEQVAIGRIQASWVILAALDRAGEPVALLGAVRRNPLCCALWFIGTAGLMGARRDLAAGWPRVRDALFGELGFRRIEVKCLETDMVARRFAMRAGFRQEAVMPGAGYYGQTLVSLRLLKDDIRLDESC